MDIHLKGRDIDNQVRVRYIRGAVRWKVTPYRNGSKWHQVRTNPSLEHGFPLPTSEHLLHYILRTGNKEKLRHKDVMRPAAGPECSTDIKAGISIFTTSAKEPASCSAPALENRRSEAGADALRRGGGPPPELHTWASLETRISGAFKWASTPLMLCHHSPGVGRGKKKVRDTLSPSSTTNPKADLTVTIFTCLRPEEEACRCGSIVEEKGGAAAF